MKTMVQPDRPLPLLANTQYSMHLILIGMPGAGKTHSGKALAAQLGWPFIDTDWEVVKRAGMSIAELIETEGMEAFRALEAEVAADALVETQSVLATGGGLPIQVDAMDTLKAAGLVVYLPVDIEVAVERIEADETKRQHLAGDVASKWASLFADRKAIYEQAHIVCNDVEQLFAFAKATLPAPQVMPPTFRG